MSNKKAMQAERDRAAGRRRGVPQGLKTCIVAFLWLCTIPIYVGLIAPFSMYLLAEAMAVGLMVFSCLAVHLWRPRTAPWRTVAWAWFSSVLVGTILMNTGFKPYALLAATVVGFVVVGVRMNENGRRLVRLAQMARVAPVGRVKR